MGRHEGVPLLANPAEDRVLAKLRHATDDLQAAAEQLRAAALALQAELNEEHDGQ